jgi:hypothetical protein
MNIGLCVCALGSTFNQVLFSNLKNGWNFPSNLRALSIDCLTNQLQNIIKCGNNKIAVVKINEYGYGGYSFDIHRCYKSLKTKIEEALMKLSENSSRNGYVLKYLYSTVYPGGTSSTTAPIVMKVGTKFGLKPLSMYIIPDSLSQGFQMVNTVICLAYSADYPVIICEESFSEMIPEETKQRATLAIGGNPSNFIKMGYFSLKFSDMISRLISGMPAEIPKEKDENKKDDDFGFLDGVENKNRNQSVEFESAIGGRSGLYVMHYARSNHANFNELTTLLPTISPENPSDPILFIQYDSAAIPESDLINDVNSSLEKQQLKGERLFCIASSKNEVLALIPTEIPDRLKALINIVKKDKPLKEVLEKWAKRTILSGIPPIRVGSTNKILKDRLSEIFFQDRSEWEEFLKKQGHLSDLDELAKTNFLYYLGKEHDVFLKPVGYEE